MTSWPISMSGMHASANSFVGLSPSERNKLCLSRETLEGLRIIITGMASALPPIGIAMATHVDSFSCSSFICGANQVSSRTARSVLFPQRETLPGSTGELFRKTENERGLFRQSQCANISEGDSLSESAGINGTKAKTW